MNMDITHLSALEILDSRGTPTLAVTLELNGTALVVAGVPSGASTGSHEALELRDGDPKRYNGKGVLKAVASVAEIFAAAKGRGFADLRDFDQWMIALDGTPNKSRLGGNAIVGCSIAFARAQTMVAGKPLYTLWDRKFPVTLPLPLFNVINGGKHADSGLSIQEFKLAPWGASSYREALRWGAETVAALRELVKDRHLSIGLGDEGGFAPALGSNEAAFDILVQAIAKAGYRPRDDIAIYVDVAATSFYDASTDQYQLDADGSWIGSKDLMERYRSWILRYPIASIEDPFAEDAWDDWTEFTGTEGHRIQVVGDDLLVTNPARVREGLKRKAANAVLLKPNQIGTISEMADTIALSREAGWRSIMSHRSGETTDSSIADLAVALGVTQMKSGSTARGERLAKYNRLLEIEAELGEQALFAPQRWGVA